MRIVCVLILTLFSFLCEGQMQSFLRPGGSGVTTNNLAANCLHCWDFEEGSGTTAGDEFGSKTLTLVNTPTWVSGAGGGNAVSLDDASSEYMYNNNISDINFDLDTDDFTVAFWYKGDSAEVSGTYLLGYYSGSPFSSISTMVRFDLVSRPAHVSYTPYTNHQLICDANWVVGGWQHHVFVYTHSDEKIVSYYKGSQASTQNFSVSSFTPASSSIFRVGFVDGNYIDIEVDQIAYWDTALDSTQVSALYNGGTALNCEDFN